MDTLPPVITVPVDLFTSTSISQATVSIGTATATDNIDGIVAVTNDAPASFPVGVTTVTWTSSDSTGNTATATQNIYVSYSSVVGGGTGGSGGTTTPPPAGGGATVTSEAVYWHHNDHLGTPQKLTDSTGTVVWVATYTPFGITTVDNDPDGDGLIVESNFRMPGQYYDHETGLFYNYFRSYDPVNGGRYTQSDPIGLKGGLNTYAYVGGSPINRYDPFGLEIFGIGIESPASNAVTNGILNPSVDPGHTFAYLMNDQGKVTHLLSVGPSSPIGALNKTSFQNGTLPAVSNWPLVGNTYNYQWPNIDGKQLKQCQQAFNALIKNPGNYSPTNQCTSSAINVAKQCGIAVPNGISDLSIPPIPLVFEGYDAKLSNPYGLQQQLDKLMHPKIVPANKF